MTTVVLEQAGVRSDSTSSSPAAESSDRSEARVHAAQKTAAEAAVKLASCMAELQQLCTAAEETQAQAIAHSHSAAQTTAEAAALEEWRRVDQLETNILEIKAAAAAEVAAAHADAAQRVEDAKGKAVKEILDMEARTAQRVLDLEATSATALADVKAQEAKAKANAASAQAQAIAAEERATKYLAECCAWKDKAAVRAAETRALDFREAKLIALNTHLEQEMAATRQQAQLHKQQEEERRALAEAEMARSVVAAQTRVAAAEAGAAQRVHEAEARATAAEAGAAQRVQEAEARAAAAEAGAAQRVHEAEARVAAAEAGAAQRVYEAEARAAAAMAEQNRAGQVHLMEVVEMAVLLERAAAEARVARAVQAAVAEERAAAEARVARAVQAAVAEERAAAEARMAEERAARMATDTRSRGLGGLMGWAVRLAKLALWGAMSIRDGVNLAAAPGLAVHHAQAPEEAQVVAAPAGELARPGSAAGLLRWVSMVLPGTSSDAVAVLQVPSWLAPRLAPKVEN
jgi:hypothetical protein